MNELIEKLKSDVEFNEKQIAKYGSSQDDYAFIIDSVYEFLRGAEKLDS